MNDFAFRQLVEKMVDATQEITWDYVDRHGEVEAEKVHAIVSYTLLSQLVCKSEMTNEQIDRLTFCVGRGEKDPDNYRPLDRREIN